MVCVNLEKPSPLAHLIVNKMFKFAEMVCANLMKASQVVLMIVLKMNDVEMDCVNLALEKLLLLAHKIARLLLLHDVEMVFVKLEKALQVVQMIVNKPTAFAETEFVKMVKLAYLVLLIVEIDVEMEFVISEKILPTVLMIVLNLELLAEMEFVNLEKLLLIAH